MKVCKIKDMFHVLLLACDGMRINPGGVYVLFCENSFVCETVNDLTAAMACPASCIADDSSSVRRYRGTSSLDRLTPGT